MLRFRALALCESDIEKIKINPIRDIMVFINHHKKSSHAVCNFAAICSLIRTVSMKF